jgi:D-psicose/D-tagatose/L-ribulose 3-epimerase
MRFGCCGGLGEADKYKRAGFDYIEVGVQAALKGRDDDAAWAASAPDVDKLPLPVEAANGLVPADLPIVGPARDLATLQLYMRRVGERAKRLGITRLVFGSGGARKRPDGVSGDEAMDHLVEFCRIAGDAVAPHGVVLVIEHLNRKETNTINSLADELELIERTNHPAVQALVDSYHYGLENEKDAALLNLGDRVRHVHVAEPINRVQPGGHGAFGDPGADKAWDFEHFFCLLRKIGYDERISFEGRWTGEVEDLAPPMLQMLRGTWQAAGRCEV